MTGDDVVPGDAGEHQCGAVTEVAAPLDVGVQRIADHQDSIAVERTPCLALEFVVDVLIDRGVGLAEVDEFSRGAVHLQDLLNEARLSTGANADHATANAVELIGIRHDQGRPRMMTEEVDHGGEAPLPVEYLFSLTHDHAAAAIQLVEGEGGLQSGRVGIAGIPQAADDEVAVPAQLGSPLDQLLKAVGAADDVLGREVDAPAAKQAAALRLRARPVVGEQHEGELVIRHPLEKFATARQPLTPENEDAVHVADNALDLAVASSQPVEERWDDDGGPPGLRVGAEQSLQILARGRFRNRDCTTIVWPHRDQLGKVTMIGFILAAGYGKRLRPLTEHVPKALAPMGGRPLLAWALERVAAAGPSAILVNSHHLAPRIAAYREESPIAFEISHEPEVRGTGGALHAATTRLAADESFCVANADILCTADLGRLHADFLATGAAIGLVADLREPKGSIYLEPRELAYLGVPAEGEAPVGSVGGDFVGIAFYRREVLDLLTPEDQSVVPVWQRARAAGLVVKVLPLGDHYWRDLGRPISLVEAHWDILTGRLPNRKLPDHLMLDLPGQRCFPRDFPVAMRERVGKLSWVEAAVPEGTSIRRSVALGRATLRPGAVYDRCLLTAWGEVDLGD